MTGARIDAQGMQEHSDVDWVSIIIRVEVINRCYESIGRRAWLFADAIKGWRKAILLGQFTDKR